MPRMRTIQAAAAYIQAQDKNTSLSKTGLRRLVITGAIPSVRVGAKYLVDLDVLESFLSSGTGKPAPQEFEGIPRVSQGVRRVL